MKSVQTIMGDVVTALNTAILGKIQSNLVTVGTVLNRTYNVNAIAYKYGHSKEVEQHVTSWLTDNEKQDKILPLIWLREDLSFGRNGDFKTVIIPSLVIMFVTTVTFTSEQRDAYVFSPVLRPIYRELLHQIYYNKDFRIADPDSQLRPTYFERKFWGTDEGKTEQAFSSPIDAIEITNFELTLQEDCEEQIF